MKYPQIILCFFLVFFPALSISAQNYTVESLILNNEIGKYPLSLYLEILEDSIGDLTIEQVSSAKYNNKFIPNQAKVPNFSFTDSVYWARFKVRDDTSELKQWLLEMSCQ